MQAGRLGEWEILAKFLDQSAIEAHSIHGVLSYLSHANFADTVDEITHALMLLSIVKPLYQSLTLQGIRSKILYGPVLLKDNTTLPPYADPEEQEELKALKWSNHPVVLWNLWSNRTFLQSLIRNDALLLMERTDVFLLRANAAFLQIKIGHCCACRFFDPTSQGTPWCRARHQPTASEAQMGRTCEDFAPKPRHPIPSSGLYVQLEPEDITLPPYTEKALYTDLEAVRRNEANTRIHRFDFHEGPA
ncbi:hypothetical protein D2Q93_16520 [Alicyclobacillaceae bacterium I2511]|nr:hypothetical protein D2Q93_16520 [Alicyclobacillaceae bacterium I2511]